MSSLVERAKPKIWFVGTRAPSGVIIGHRFGLRHAGIIDDDDFIARIGRARGQPEAAHHARQEGQEPIHIRLESGHMQG